MKYDVFLSYAKEDVETAVRYYGRLKKAGLEVFFAPKTLPPNVADLHSELLAALRQSDAILLLWTPYVDKSQWVAFEASIHATMRLEPGRPDFALILLDLGGPRAPAWATVDLVLDGESEVHLETILRKGEWKRPLQDRARARARLTGVLGSALLCQASWVRRVRSALPRLGPNFSVAQIRPDEAARPEVTAMVNECLIGMLGWCGLMAGIGWLLGGLVFQSSYVPKWSGYVKREVLLTPCLATAAGLILILRVGLAAGVAAAVAGAACGTTLAVAMGWIARPDPLTGAVTAGVVLGTCAAISYLLGSTARTEDVRPRKWNARPLIGVASAIGVAGGAQLLAAEIGRRYHDPHGVTRAGIGLFLGGLIFAVPAVVAGWAAYRQKRGYLWRSAAKFFFWIWLTLAALAAGFSALVPFGNPFTALDGVGVGLLSGAAAAGVLTLLVHFLEPVTGESWCVPIAVAALLIVAYPILMGFENLRASMAILYPGLTIATQVAFLAVLAVHRRHAAALFQFD
jgi:hypothetical protein